MSLIALIVYITFVVVVMFLPGSVTVGDREVINPIARGLVAVIAWPVISLIFLLLGLIGKLMFLPFVDVLFQIAH